MQSENFNTPSKMFSGDLGEEIVRIKILGVGGAGNNAVDRLKLDNLDRIHLAAINTDAQALAASPVQEKLMIGRSITRGLSTGGEPDLGKKAAEIDRDKITKLVGGTDLVFLLAGLGGGTGSGAAPVIAEIAAQQGALVIAFVTLPFTMEGTRRNATAEAALNELRTVCHAVIPLPNDILLQQMDEHATVLDAFAQADAWINRGVRSICSMLFNTGLINLDFATLRKAFTNRGGKTLFGLGTAKAGESVADALHDLLICPLLHTPELSRRADSLVVNIVGGASLSLAKVNEIMSFVAEKFGSRENTVLGAVIDESMQDTLEICVIGTTDIGHRKPARKHAIALPPKPAQTPPPAAPASQEAPATSAAGLDNVKAPAAKTKEHADPDSQGEFTFVADDEHRGFFDHTDRFFFEGEDIDVPTFRRRGIKVHLE